MFAKPDKVMIPVDVAHALGPIEEDNVITGVGFTTTSTVADVEGQLRLGLE